MRDSVVFYRSFWEAIEDLPEAEFKQAITALMQYALNEIEPEVSGVAKTFFRMAKPQVDANNKRYQNGSRGGRPRNNQTETKPKPNNNQTETKPEPNEKEKEKENVKEKDKKEFCPEAEESAPGNNAAVTFILNDGSLYTVTENDVNLFQQLYPGIDCMQELRNIKGWCLANPKNRKTRSGAKRFLNAWLSRAQNATKPEKPQYPVSASTNRFNNFDQREVDYDALAMEKLKERLAK